MKKIIVFLLCEFAIVLLSVCAVAESYLWPVPSSTSISQGYSSGHPALDITGGESIVATKSGTVYYTYTGCNNNNSASRHVSCTSATCNPSAGLNSIYYDSNYGVSTCNWGSGNGVVLAHNDGTFSVYCHMSSVYVSRNQDVKQGDVLGTMGSTGTSTGKHLHFEISTSKKDSGTFIQMTNPINNMPNSISYIYSLPVSGTIDVNSILDGIDTGAGTVMNGVCYGTFDIYINGSLLSGKDDIAPTVCSSYEITNIKPTTGHVYSGIVGNLSGTVSAGQAVTVKLKFDTCMNHTYNSGTITTQPTCTSTGIRTFTCTKCGATKTETVAKLEHTIVTDPAVPATVTSTGLTAGSHCSVCGTVIVKQEIIPKLPRVKYDFDMDGTAEPVLKLPSGLKTIEEEAFAGDNARVIIIPDGVTTIRSRAFADMPNLCAVLWPESVLYTAFDIFENSPNVTLYVSKGSKWGMRLDLPYVEIDTGWVTEDEVPTGAEIVDQKWTYTTREYTESSSASYPGWTSNGSKITSWTDWSGWQNSEISGSSTREVRTQTIITGYNMITYCVSGPQGRSYQPSPTYTVRLQHGPYWWSKAELDSARVFSAGSYFDYDSNVAGYVLDGTAYCKWDGSNTGGFVPMFVQDTIYGTQWSYRDAVYTYYYYKESNEESATDPSGRDNVTNVQKWVKYSYK